MNRMISNKTLKPTEDACNAKLASRDGYCEKLPMVNSDRCVHHTRSNSLDEEAKGIFSSALTAKQAKQLEALIRDSQSMEGEIAVQKTELVHDLNKERELEKMYFDLLEVEIPQPEPIDENIPNDFERFREETKAMKLAIDEKNRKMDEVKDGYDKVSKRVQIMADQITRAVERNNKVAHGTKYTISIQQLTEVLHVQLNILENYCKGCPKLAEIAKEFGSMKLKGIGSIQDAASFTGLPNKVKRECKRAIMNSSDKLDEELIQNLRLEIGGNNEEEINQS